MLQHMIWLSLGLAVCLPAVAADSLEALSREALESRAAERGYLGLDARVELLRRDAPDLVAEIMTAQPSGYTRHGRPRMMSESFADPVAWPAIEQRLRSGVDSVDVRLALLAWLPATVDWPIAARGLLSDLEEPELRAAVVFVAARERSLQSLPLLERGLVDAHPSVRRVAARGLAGVPGADGALRDALRDLDPSVRAAAAFSVGVRGDREATPPLTALLTDPSSEVRLDALRALERLLGSDISTVPSLTQMVDDPDPRIQARAKALVRR